jgi:hypothetical protein
MRQIQGPSEMHLNWDAILILIAVLLVCTSIWGAAIRALVGLLR